MIDVADLIQTILGTGIIYMFIDRLKVQLPERAHRWIPELCALLGVGLVCSALYVTGPQADVRWLLGVLQGITAGYAAVGVHASKKQHSVQ